MVYIGIDPGKNGGVAVISESGKCAAIKCPDTILDMVTQLREISYPAKESKLAIEKVHAFPGQGVTSMFNFGKGYGQWLGIIAALEIPYMDVSPYRWQKYYGKLPKEKKDRKNLLKHYAQQRFPDIKATLVTTDAILIANWLYKAENM